MFSFAQEQQIAEISGIHIGGQPGVYPTVLIGGFFFKGDPDYIKAKKHLNTALQICEETSIPFIPDFFIRSHSEIEDTITFIQETVPHDLPFSVDIIESEIKIAVLQQLKEKNMLNRTIYNSLHIGLTSEEKQTLESCTPAASIIVAFNPKDKSPDGKIEVLETGANLQKKGLLEFAKEIGINTILIDTAATAPETNSGGAIAAIPVIKEEYGHPTGCAIHNVVEKSDWLDDLGGSAKKRVDVAANTTIPLYGGDYAIIGPVENTPKVAPIIAWEDILISEYAEQYFDITPASNHPRRKYYSHG